MPDQHLRLLSHPQGKVARFVSGAPKGPYDMAVISDLEAHDVPYADSLDQHKADFHQFRITPREYVDRYYIGHCSPRGNHFFAYAVKDAVVGWLDPKPITYQDLQSK